MVRPFEPLHFLTTCWYMRPLTAIFAAAAIALPWYWAVGLATEGEFLRRFFLVENVARATGVAMEGHHGNIFYYPVAILVGFFPWSLFAAPLLIDLWLQLRRREGVQSGLRSGGVLGGHLRHRVFARAYETAELCHALLPGPRPADRQLCRSLESRCFGGHRPLAVGRVWWTGSGRRGNRHRHSARRAEIPAGRGVAGADRPDAAGRRGRSGWASSRFATIGRRRASLAPPPLPSPPSCSLWERSRSIGIKRATCCWTRLPPIPQTPRSPRIKS